MSNSNGNYNLSNSKPLISREQNYVLDRKLVTVHSEDRDITKWKNSNTFEIMLPETLMNVQSIRLVQMTLPGFYYTFSNGYQNTKFNFKVGNSSTEYNVVIDEGFYTAAQLTTELTNKMNAAYTTDNSFNVIYDEIKNKFWFGHTDSSFNFDFKNQINYDFSNCEQQPIVWNNHTKWGLPYNLGFKKEAYTSIKDASGLTFDYKTPNTTNLTHYIEAPLSFDINGENCIYMEVEKYNSYDELYPYNESNFSNIFSNNAYAGKVNSAFAKIPLRIVGDNVYDSRTFYLHNLVHYDPPIERIVRLKFKFRFHDGRLVNFQNFPFDFTLELNSLKNEINKTYNIRIPAAYIL